MALVGFALLFQILLQCLGAFFGMSMREFNLEKEHTPATNETKSLDSMNLPILEKSHSPAIIVTKSLGGINQPTLYKSLTPVSLVMKSLDDMN